MADMWWWLLLGVFGQQAGQKAARPEPAAVESRITVRELDSLLGGQGTINVPSRSPKGQLFAYITYRPLGAGDTASR
jgi:hypothetical protein